MADSNPMTRGSLQGKVDIHDLVTVGSHSQTIPGAYEKVKQGAAGVSVGYWSSNPGTPVDVCLIAPPSPHIEVNDERWSIWLDAETTFMECVALMGGLRLIGIDVMAHALQDGVVSLVPTYPWRPVPTAYELYHCMRIGAKLGPNLPKVRFTP